MTRFALLGFVVATAVGCSQTSPAGPSPAGPSPAGGAGSTNAIVEGADAGGRPLTAELTGAAEAPGPGDPDGTGTALITLNYGQGEVCWELTVADIAPATAAHIHEAPVGVAGPVRVPLSPPASGSSSGCASVMRERIKDILQNPEAYYVNVHNPAFPAGAVRGQLSK